MRVEWDQRKVMVKVEGISETWSKKYAKKIKAKALRNLRSNMDSTTVYTKGRKPGHLAREIEITTSRYKTGGHAVVAQGPGKWSEPDHASFVELGTPKKGIAVFGNKEHRVKLPGEPFMRPAYKTYKRPAIKDLKANLI